MHWDTVRSPLVVGWIEVCTYEGSAIALILDTCKIKQERSLFFYVD
ncbi:hypothetical protein OGM63_23130 [Plectonema radiosum NIES-515]|uniref:Uncharacterized protein n=1 Tax=Plectonema radiosum NIES-515 TaxID=2986073 RepID=A0ABT3B647_9CYAN|nr:hypothetical protein [Plectonema radiosum]MCV3216369.1 hypothetical protein [Plectonema radiosum NIES-515]